MIRKATSGSLWSSSPPVDPNRLPSSGQIPDLIGHLAVLRSLKGLCALGRLAASRSKSKSKLHLCHSQAATEKGLATLTSPPPPSPPPKRPPPVDTSPLPGFVLFYECFVPSRIHLEPHRILHIYVQNNVHHDSTDHSQARG